jgi:hypothetical protein
MKPGFLIALILSVSSVSTAAMLFWDASPKPIKKRSTPPTSVEIKWGEGSEAGAPDMAAHK